jgi:MoaA/NifB/PqqE/SkfB family radical SAM enzyme
MDSGAGRSTVLPENVVLRCLSAAEELGIGTVYLSGGEPFLHPNFSDILSSLPELRPFSIAVSTNGTLIGTREAECLKAINVTAQVSIDGAEEYHDTFRSMPGAFRAAARGIRELVKAGVPVVVVTTICSDNLDVLSWLSAWALDLGVSCISVQPLQELGRARTIVSKKLSPQQMCRLFLQVSDLGYAYAKRGLYFRLAYRSRDHLLEHPCAAYVCNGSKCHRGVSKEIKTLIVREDGVVLPEIATLNPRYALGNVNEASLPELIAGYFETGYAEFHELCSRVYFEVVPEYLSPIIPWNELLSERSWTGPAPTLTLDKGCGARLTPTPTEVVTEIVAPSRPTTLEGCPPGAPSSHALS